MSRFKNLIWLLVGCWLATAFVSVAQADFEDGVAAYEQGDYDRAVWWFRKAAEQGDATAQTSLGVMYGLGRGIPKDVVLAYMWFNLAAPQGYADAAKNLNIVEGLMTPVQIAEAQHLASEWLKAHPQ